MHTTPDALKKALETLKKQTDGNLICIFGCGGERDNRKKKRYGRSSFQNSRYQFYYVRLIQEMKTLKILLMKLVNI